MHAGAPLDPRKGCLRYLQGGAHGEPGRVFVRPRIAEVGQQTTPFGAGDVPTPGAHDLQAARPGRPQQVQGVLRVAGGIGEEPAGEDGDLPPLDGGGGLRGGAGGGGRPHLAALDALRQLPGLLFGRHAELRFEGAAETVVATEGEAALTAQRRQAHGPADPLVVPRRQRVEAQGEGQGSAGVSPRFPAGGEALQQQQRPLPQPLPADLQPIFELGARVQRESLHQLPPVQVDPSLQAPQAGEAVRPVGRARAFRQGGEKRCRIEFVRTLRGEAEGVTVGDQAVGCRGRGAGA